MKINICVLCGNERGGWINTKLFGGLMDTVIACAGRHLVGINFLADCTPVEHARNMAALEALQQGADWLLMIDNDQVLPQNIVQLLEAAAADPEINVVSLPTYMMRRGQDNPSPVLNNWVLRDASDKWVDRTTLAPVPGFQQVQNAGAGVLLVRCSVFQHIQQPWFKVLLDEKTCKPLCGEDDYFCARVREQGLKIHTHSGYECGHLKTVDLTGVAKLLATKAISPETVDNSKWIQQPKRGN